MMFVDWYELQVTGRECHCHRWTMLNTRPGRPNLEDARNGPLSLRQNATISADAWKLP
jgi:hypothetical protein